MEPGEIPDLVADRDAVQTGIRERGDRCGAVGEQEEPEPRRLGEFLLHREAHVVDVRGFIHLVPETLAAPLDEGRNPAEQRFHLGPGHPVIGGILAERADEHVERAEGVTAPVPARLDAVSPVISGERVLGDARLLKVIESAPGESLRGGRALGLGCRQYVRDQILCVGGEGQVTHARAIPVTAAATCSVVIRY